MAIETIFDRKAEICQESVNRLRSYLAIDRGDVMSKQDGDAW